MPKERFDLFGVANFDSILKILASLFTLHSAFVFSSSREDL